MAHFIGLDAGTTGVTAVLYDESFGVIRRESEEIRQIYPAPGHVEHDAAEIRDKSIAILKRLSGGDFTEIAAIGITNQRETTVAFDVRTGEPLANAIVWQCRRTAERCRVLEADGHIDMIRARTGLLLDAYFSATKMEWLLANVPAVASAAEAGALRLATVDAWLVHALTGGAVFATDPTNASRTLLYDLDAGDWQDELLDLFGVRRDFLPEIRPSAGDFGRTARSVLGAEVPLRGVAGDQQAALFGQGCFEPGLAKCTYGTGAFLLLSVPDGAPRPKGGLLQTARAARDGGTGSAYEGAVFVAGAAIQWLRDELGLITDAAETAAIAESIDSTEGVYLVPAFTGLGAPYWDPEARGILSGLTRGSGRAHVVRAALEGIAHQVADLLEAMAMGGSGSVAELRVDGGAAANDFLLQFQADVAGLPVSRGGDLESTARGAAGLAAVAMGHEAGAIGGGARVRFEPRWSAEERAAARTGWAHAVRQARL